jgi:uncharacterized protein YbjQ (UPF0145 family)
MANCKVCDKQLGFMEGNKGYCSHCFAKHALAEQTGRHEELEQLKKKKNQRDATIERIILTTETQSDLKVLKRLEIVTAECAFGMNMFKDLFAGVRDIVGGRSEAVQKTMRDARRTALYELKKEAYEVGANAVVGVDLDYVELSAAGSMVMLVASGTAVVVEQ